MFAKGKSGFWLFLAAAFVTVLAFPQFALAAPPVVKTVPWVATNPLIPHDTYAGKAVRLKGTSDVSGGNILYSWDFGDGSAPATGTVENNYVIEAQHTYAGATGTVYTARLTVTNTDTAPALSASAEYFVAMREKTLQVEVNIAIDEGLWELHKAQTRSSSNGVDYGNWGSWSGYPAMWAAAVNAFEVNGHLESGLSSNPYVETVQRGMRNLFWQLASQTIGVQGPGGINDPDTNANGIGLYVNSSYPPYQGGIFMDAIVASGTPDALVAAGPGDVAGRKYKDIVQDMVDWYAWADYDYDASGQQSANTLGGWRYGANQWPDNSVCQWAAIGMLAAERVWGIAIPQFVIDYNLNWLTYSHSPNGIFGYTGTSYMGGWGPYALTASGLVQLVLDGKGRGYPLWDATETFLRNQWDNASGYDSGPMKTRNYYALFSFSKSMLLHQPPIVKLHSSSVGVDDLDWYGAEASKGAPSDGLARALVNAQSTDGYWWYHNYTGDAYPFETPWAIMMLNQTIIHAGAPVAVARATPNPAVAGAAITLDGSASYHQDPTKKIVKWEWDLNNDGVYERTGVTVTISYRALGSYPAKLRVTDNASPPTTAETTVVLLVNTPPIAPTANAGGPYVFCPGQKWYLDGSKSINPDDGQHEIGAYPGDTLATAHGYAWDLDGAGTFLTYGKQVDVTNHWPVGGYLINLKVTDRTAASFPSSGLGNLSSVSSAQVTVKQACGCITSLSAIGKLGRAQLTWRRSAADHYNVYRAKVSGGPYTLIGKVANAATGTARAYLDTKVVVGTTYYYVVREAALNGDEYCQSNQAGVRVPR